MEQGGVKKKKGRGGGILIDREALKSRAKEKKKKVATKLSMVLDEKQKGGKKRNGLNPDTAKLQNTKGRIGIEKLFGR